MTYTQSARPAGTHNRSTLSSATIREIQAGPLTTQGCAERIAAADRHGHHPLAHFTLDECLHLKRIQLTLTPNATWQDAIEVLRHTSAEV
jgi:hypothetical protein